jgi:hypothetical protein
MAKANITTKDGATITIEGTAEEVAAMLVRFNGPSTGRSNEDVVESKPRGKGKIGKSKGNTQSGGKKKSSPTTLITELIENGFFNKPKALADIQAELKQGGHYYPNAGVASPLLRAVRGRNLRRIKGESGWTYVV